MEILLTVLKIFIYTWILRVALAQTNNLIFMLWRRPLLWIALLALVGILNMWLAFELNWNPGIVSCSVLLATIFGWPPPLPKGRAKSEALDAIDTGYRELGIQRGRLKYRLGMIAFGLSSAVGYVLFFGEVCDAGDQCRHLF
jgi:hypothetical protein